MSASGSGLRGALGEKGITRTPSGTRVTPEETAGVREGAEGKGAAFQRMGGSYAWGVRSAPRSGGGDV